MKIRQRLRISSRERRGCRWGFPGQWQEQGRQDVSAAEVEETEVEELELRLHSNTATNADPRTNATRHSINAVETHPSNLRLRRFCVHARPIDDHATVNFQKESNFSSLPVVSLLYGMPIKEVESCKYLLGV